MQTNLDQEMDKLLRAHGAVASRAQNEQRENFVESSHLDADALSAYIENALPAATRAHYTAHLVDCAACRRLAVTFASTLDIASKEIESDVAASEKVASKDTAFEQTTTAITPSAAQSAIRNPNSAIKTDWRARLAAFFAPSFMRYAVPVFVIGIVGVVTYIAFNSSQRRQTSAPDAGLVASRTESSGTSSAVAPQTASNANSSSDAKTSAQNPTTKQVVTASAPAKPEPPSIAAKEPQDATRKDERARVNEKPNDAPQTSTQSESVSSGAQLAQSTRSAPPKSANAATDELETVERKQQNEPARREQDAQKAQTSNAETQAATNDANKSGNDLSTVASGAAATQSRRATSGMAKKAESKDKEKSDRDAQSGAAGGLAFGAARTVAGHRFQRQNSVWIDAAYNSQKIINVARDSEQFRALASDEPELRRIANELSGTIIVVLRGRAYRIR